MKIYPYVCFFIKNNMPEVSHYNAAYLLTYTHPRCMKCLLNILFKMNLAVTYEIHYYIFEYGDIILNRSNNSMFLRLKIYWNRQVFDLIRATRIWINPKRFVTSLFLKILNSIFQTINVSVHHKLLVQLFLTGFYLFCSKIGDR